MSPLAKMVRGVLLMMVRVSVVAAMKLSLSARSSLKNGTYAMEGLTYIADPVAQRLADLERQPVDLTGMGQSAVVAPDGSYVRIATFPNHEDVHVSAKLNSGQAWEGKQTKRIFDAWRREGWRRGNFLDVGANIGAYTLPLASAMGAGHKVIAVEAMPPIADHLRGGVLLNKADNIILFPYAIGEPATSNSVEMALSPSNKGGSAVVGNKAWTNGAVQKFSVELTTIDALVKVEPEMTNIFYAKFDIEGNEGRAIAGAQRFFGSFPPCYAFLELNAEFLGRAGTTVAAVESELAKFGYDVANSVPLGYLNKEYKQKDFDKCVQRLH